MPDAVLVDWVRQKYQALRGTLHEQSRRLWAAAEARSLGRGGIAAVIAATGMSSATVHKGLAELETRARGNEGLPPDRIRRPGGGRKRAIDQQPGLAAALESLVEPTVRGDPECALRWTCKSTYKLTAELRRQGFRVSPRTVAKALKDQDFSLQANDGLSLSAGHEQVEQDRTPDVLPRHAELAGASPHELCRHRSTHRLHDDRDRAANPSRVGRAYLPYG